MGRNRKFEIGDVALVSKPIDGVSEMDTIPYYAVVVDWTKDNYGRHYYRMIRTLHPVNGALFGEPFHMAAHHALKTDYPNRRVSTYGIYLANERMGKERGCTCMCCAHEAIPRSEIASDGTFKWEREYGTD